MYSKCHETYSSLVNIYKIFKLLTSMYYNQNPFPSHNSFAALAN